MKILFKLFIILLLFAPGVCAKDLRFAQITDVKYIKSENNEVLTKVINDINKHKDIQFVVFTGDNIGKPSKENLLAFLSETKKLKCPYYIVIGDKDVNKRRELGKKEYSKIVHKHAKRYKPKTPNYVFEKNGIIFLVADGAKEVIPSTTGYYKDDVIDWVDANLDLYKDKPVIILQHFPLLNTMTSKETYYTFKADNYLEMLSKHPNVKAVITGHLGINKEQKENNIVHITTAPLPNYRIIDLINYDSDDITIWAEVKNVK